MADLAFRKDWRKVGDSEYRVVTDASDLIGCSVVNANFDTIFLVNGDRKFVIYLNGQDCPVDEYRLCSPTK